MKVLDRNEQHGLALVEEHNRYIALSEVPAGSEDVEIPYVYLKQKHYVARAHAQGLFIVKVDPMLEGWASADRWDAHLLGRST